MAILSPFSEQLNGLPQRVRELSIDGTLTRWREYGRPDDPPVVFVHGFRGDHHGLEPVVAQLRGLRIIAPDLPGFGASDRFADHEHSLASYAAWLRAFVDALELPDPPVVLGHSFGSLVVSAAVAAGLQPERVILVNPIASPALSGPRGLLTRLAVLYYRLGAALPERAGHLLLSHPIIVRAMSIVMAKTRNRARRAFIHDQHDRYFSAFADREVVLEAFRASISHDIPEFAHALSMPVLLIAAERDDVCDLASQRRLHALLPSSELRVIPEVGHLIHYETPEAAAAHLQAFLSDGQSASPR